MMLSLTLLSVQIQVLSHWLSLWYSARSKSKGVWGVVKAHGNKKGASLFPLSPYSSSTFDSLDSLRSLQDSLNWALPAWQRIAKLLPLEAQFHHILFFWRAAMWPALVICENSLPLSHSVQPFFGSISYRCSCWGWASGISANTKVPSCSSPLYKSRVLAGPLHTSSPHCKINLGALQCIIKCAFYVNGYSVVFREQ